jgi:hypothetical protein
MTNFFRWLFRSTRDPRYRIMGPDPFPHFRHYILGLDGAYGGGAMRRCAPGALLTRHPPQGAV